MVESVGEHPFSLSFLFTDPQIYSGQIIYPAKRLVSVTKNISWDLKVFFFFFFFEKFSLYLPPPLNFLLSLFYPVWNIEVMAGGPAATLDHEVTTGTQGKEIEEAKSTSSCWPLYNLLDCTPLAFTDMSKYTFTSLRECLCPVKLNTVFPAI